MNAIDNHLERRELLPALVRAICVVMFILDIFSGRIPLSEQGFQSIMFVFLGIAVYIIASLFVPAGVVFLQVLLFFLDAAGLILLSAKSGGVHSHYLFLAPFLAVFAGIRFGVWFSLCIAVLAAAAPTVIVYAASRTFHPNDAFMWIVANVAAFLFFLRFTEKSETQKYVALYMDLEQQNEHLEHTLRELEEKMSTQSIIDPATGLKNFRYFRLRIAEEISRAHRQKYPFCLCLMELEGMEEFEKVYGKKEHQAALQKVAAKVSDIVRDTDLVGKCMDHQILMLMPMANARQALTPVMRIRKSMANIALGDDGRFETTAAFGIVCYPDDVQELGGLLALANSALQRSREKGKGMVTLGCSLFDRPLTS